MLAVIRDVVSSGIFSPLTLQPTKSGFSYSLYFWYWLFGGVGHCGGVA